MEVNGFTKTAVIAGVGTREYYKNKCGYYLGDTYMLKNLQTYDNKNILRASVLGLMSVIMFGIFTLFKKFI